MISVVHRTVSTSPDFTEEVSVSEFVQREFPSFKILDHMLMSNPFIFMDEDNETQKIQVTSLKPNYSCVNNC